MSINSFFNFVHFFAMIFANVSLLKLHQQTLEGLINIKSRCKSYKNTLTPQCDLK